MTKLYLIRHGQSLANQSRRFAGNFDIDLTETGYQQAARIPTYFANIQIDAIFASDLQRAYNTAVPLARERGMEIIKAAAFREIFAGAWEGALFEEIQKNYAADYDVWLHDIGNARCSDGETVRHLGERVLSAITKIAQEYDGKNVVIATHATPIRALISLWETGDVVNMKQYTWVPNASITAVSYQNGIFSLTDIGATNHLEGLLTKLPTNV